MMPKKYQRGFIDSVVRAARKQEEEVIKKMNENQVFDRVSA